MCVWIVILLLTTSFALAFKAWVMRQKLASPMPTIQVVNPTQGHYIHLDLFSELNALLVRVRPSELDIQKLLISHDRMVISGKTPKQEAFYNFWQKLKQAPQIHEIVLLHWYGKYKDAYQFSLSVRFV